MTSHTGRGDPAHDEILLRQIDAALQLFARATPPENFDARIEASLHQALALPAPIPPTLRLRLLRWTAVGALATAAACGIVVATIEHSRNAASVPMAHRASPSTGGATTAGQSVIPTRGVQVSPELRPGHAYTPPHSRATITRNAPHRKGAAVPSSPYPPDEKPSNPQQ